MQLPDWLLIAKHSVKCSGAIAEDQDVSIQKYLKVTNDAEDAPI